MVMQVDPTNKIVQLCGNGMLLEGEGKPEEARRLFRQAWREATSDYERLIAAHYVARHQESIADKLKWDQTALRAAQNVRDYSLNKFFPSLYLNIGKDYEDLQQWEEARKNYEWAAAYAGFLPNDGYGKMIRTGISNGLARMRKD